MYPRPYSAYSDPPATGGFRVVCFNVLADYLAAESQQHARPYDAYKFSWAFRRTRLLREMLTWQADIICLQEVDHFTDYFEPELAQHGYIGRAKQRTGETTLDGCAIFVKASTFEILETVGIEYKVPGHDVLDRDNVALALVLRSIGDGAVLIAATTHILFNPRRGDVKLAQCQLLFETLAALQASHASDRLLLCGDFNFTPCSPLYALFSTGALNCDRLQPPDLSCQVSPSGSFFHERRHVETEDEARHHGAGTAAGRFDPTRRGPTKRSPPSKFNKAIGGTVSHPFALASAYAQRPTELTTGEPLVTTFHERFFGSVDYIWFSAPTLQCTGVVEMPDHAAFFKRIRGLPTQHVSSDHLSLVADFA
ncbi:hypothetical protein SPRG_01662 [Saprolegnia parasitica CBS 223.65]|uniref:Endonuclease/exonuclease/phosphatase domain-containing protein n=1 Tax=Saprolegnia parasitica (strain CBS 223.65) TaxID=695850 RepID=A0A067CTG2_SAPPC|nr:hypothetical protein SPRG_01662 [Saprolegnia parasitica CBS 223.65]KDO33783.1 hypothetical protein SPRG_01662 [Saprolegnia parasitica CBS 223.65]|eukprot:XP_012195419.1 hypothetical protein SPRG_01662 [Saprolegnia parasitica CBS 223.65]